MNDNNNAAEFQFSSSIEENFTGEGEDEKESAPTTHHRAPIAKKNVGNLNWRRNSTRYKQKRSTSNTNAKPSNVNSDSSNLVSYTIEYDRYDHLSLLSLRFV